MPVISTDRDGVALVNTFTVEPENHERLLEILREATDDVMRHLPGFVSASVHASLDGTRVCNYAQWSSEEAFRAAIAHPDSKPHFAACQAIASSDSALYQLRFTEG
ncbi:MULTISPECIES: antibiotic biosynthesis monooxygenase family protein [unclassified Nocardiopsis]|jgi:quinol monooxygenase YgiN|uniref:antibiotic biosynthesis monooxygenase family protein n=1 Tax=unclassified Nocardiopsis TaxID=2649073 RepID=UPI00066E5148|nr:MULTISPECIES: antibiotic biosynthesis monooxygenase family protein [unclassified Nocardiopsis]MBQ1082430.1 antibiotic biosynthesis monooxygenase [Nocardiopsis sp. B62]